MSVWEFQPSSADKLSSDNAAGMQWYTGTSPSPIDAPQPDPTDQLPSLNSPNHNEHESEQGQDNDRFTEDANALLQHVQSTRSSPPSYPPGSRNAGAIGSGRRSVPHQSQAVGSGMEFVPSVHVVGGNEQTSTGVSSNSTHLETVYQQGASPSTQTVPVSFSKTGTGVSPTGHITHGGLMFRQVSPPPQGGGLSQRMGGFHSGGTVGNMHSMSGMGGGSSNLGNGGLVGSMGMGGNIGAVNGIGNMSGMQGVNGMSSMNSSGISGQGQVVYDHGVQYRTVGEFQPSMDPSSMGAMGGMQNMQMQPVGVGQMQSAPQVQSYPCGMAGVVYHEAQYPGSNSMGMNMGAVQGANGMGSIGGGMAVHSQGMNQGGFQSFQVGGVNNMSSMNTMGGVSQMQGMQGGGNFGGVQQVQGMQFQTSWSSQPKKGPVEMEERTTVMLRNVPYDARQRGVLNLLLDHGFGGSFDFFYCPLDFRSKNNLGYAFVNFRNPTLANDFAKYFDGFRVNDRPGWDKELRVCCARVQGLVSNVEHYKNSPVNDMPEDFKPMLFDEQGRNYPFPPPDNRPSSPQRGQGPIAVRPRERRLHGQLQQQMQRQGIHNAPSKRSTQNGELPNPQPHKLFIGGMSPETTNITLWRYMSQFGDVAEAEVLLDHQTGRSRTFGFCSFYDPTAANAALNKKEHFLDGRSVVVRPYTSFTGPVGQRNGGAAMHYTQTNTTQNGQLEQGQTEIQGGVWITPFGSHHIPGPPPAFPSASASSAPIPLTVDKVEEVDAEIEQHASENELMLQLPKAGEECSAENPGEALSEPAPAKGSTEKGEPWQQEMHGATASETHGDIKSVKSN